MLKFTQEHEWVRIEGDVATAGITQHAQERLGDLVFVELPVVGKSFEKGAPAAVVESVKAAFEVYAPIGGEVVEANPGNRRQSVAGQFRSNGRRLVLQIEARQSFGGRRAPR